MADLRWVYDLTIFLYAASVLCYFNDFLHSNRRMKQIATVLLSTVWILQTAYFVYQMIMKEHIPIITYFEILFFYSWILVTISLLIYLFTRIEFLIFFTNVIGFGVFVLSMFFSEPTAPHTNGVNSEFIFIHVSIAIISYALLAVSMIFSGMYLLSLKMLKQKRFTPLFQRLPSLEKMDAFSYRLHIFGVPLLLLSVILGSIWAQLIFGQQFLTDAKVWMSIWVLLLYMTLLFQRFRNQWMGKVVAWVNIFAFICLLLNFLLIDPYSQFHRWS
ncbi:cytochrome C assembly family protein [Brevibacillus daliensis]|uniref:cytochrome C assembly family protein n=1 Tax=Brevibacillus daliensis TaxID=2892995 RepID=UPI001E3A8D49|nr:cytochrome c biogenesis protein CcsA [Brevibacillus daliensis]